VRYPKKDISFTLKDSTDKAEHYSGVLSQLPAYIVTLKLEKLGGKGFVLTENFFDTDGNTHIITLDYRYRFKRAEAVTVFAFKVDLGSRIVKDIIFYTGEYRGYGLNYAIQVLNYRKCYLIDVLAEYVKNAKDYEVIKGKFSKNNSVPKLENGTVDLEFLWSVRVSLAVSNAVKKKPREKESEIIRGFILPP
jgi:hypothetical protein